MDLILPSSLDVEHLSIIRENVSAFLMLCSQRFDESQKRLLDIAPQIHEGAKAYFKKCTISTLDIDKNSGADYIADLCATNEALIPNQYFDIIVCTEVLEHTLHPFNAVNEIWRMLKPGGAVCVSVPFNFRIHGPLPDCWRFTEHGLRSLFSSFTIDYLNQIDTPDRGLMPIHYTLIASK